MSFFSRSATPRWMRITSAATAMTFTWIFVLSVPAISLAQEHLKTKTKPAAPKPPAPWKPGKRVPPPASLKQNLTPLTDAQILKLRSLPTNQNLNSRRSQLKPDLSLFDIAGHLIKSATPAQIAQWKNSLKTSHSSEEKARLHRVSLD